MVDFGNGNIGSLASVAAASDGSGSNGLDLSSSALQSASIRLVCKGWDEGSTEGPVCNNLPGITKATGFSTWLELDETTEEGTGSETDKYAKVEPGTAPGLLLTTGVL